MLANLAILSNPYIDLSKRENFSSKKKPQNCGFFRHDTPNIGFTYLQTGHQIQK